MKNRNITKQKGFNLIEILIVLGIIAVGVAAVVAYQSRATTSSTANRFVSEISLIATQARVWKGAKTTYTGVSMTVLTAQELLEPTWATGTGVNPAGGNYTVAANATPTRLTVTATGMPTALCLNVENQIEASTYQGANASCSGGTLTAVFQ